MRNRIGWGQVLAGWVLVLILALAGFGVVELVPSLGLAGGNAAVQGARIPQGTRVPQVDPFDLDPPAFKDDAAVDASDD